MIRAKRACPPHRHRHPQLPLCVKGPLCTTISCSTPLPFLLPFQQPVAAHAYVKYTTAHPFTPEFVQSHLTASNKNSSKSRAQALYDERVRRRQIGLAERRSQVSREKGKKVGRKKAGLGGKDDAARVRAKMGRREAAEKGVWRLRADEARYEPLGLSLLNLLLSFPFFKILGGTRSSRCIGCGSGTCLSSLDLEPRRHRRRRGKGLLLPRRCLSPRGQYKPNSSRRTFTARS